MQFRCLSFCQYFSLQLSRFPLIVCVPTGPGGPAPPSSPTSTGTSGVVKSNTRYDLEATYDRVLGIASLSVNGVVQVHVDKAFDYNGVCPMVYLYPRTQCVLTAAVYSVCANTL